jgi:hypothetical protein
MAASYTWGVLAADVAAELHGIDDAAVGAATTPVSTTNLTTWINDGAGRFNAVLAKSGITPSASVDADAHQAIATGVKMYAAHKAMLVMGVMGPALDEAKMEWLAIYTEYSNRPQQLGNAYAGGLTTASDSDTKSEAWDFTNSEGSVW